MDAPIADFEDPSPGRKLAKGIFIILFARLCFALVITLAREASALIPLAEVVFFQNLVSLVLLIPFLGSFGLKSFKTEKLGLIFIRTLFGLLAFIFLFMSSQKLPLTQAILLNNTAPIFVPIVSWIWKKKKINHKLWIGIVLGFIGVAWILKPTPSIAENHVWDTELGSLYGVISGLCLAIALKSMRILRKEKVFSVLLYYYALSSIMVLPFSLQEWKTPTLSLGVLLVIIGVLTLLTQSSYLKAFHYGKASVLSPFFYVAVVYGALIDWLIYQQHFSWTFLVGVLFICVGGILTFIFGLPNGKPQA